MTRRAPEKPGEVVSFYSQALAGVILVKVAKNDRFGVAVAVHPSQGALLAIGVFQYFGVAVIHS
jgi:hypothetical protein